MTTRTHHTLPRLYQEGPCSADLELPLSDDKAHYLRHVLRLSPKDLVRVFNAEAGEWLAEFVVHSKHNCALCPTEQVINPRTESGPILAMAPIKKNHFDFMIEKATELGTTAIHPILTERTQIREINTDRMRSLVIEAAEQSERLTIPHIAPATPLQKYIANAPLDHPLIICAEWGDAQPIADVCNALKNTTQPPIIMTGPEGGFSAIDMALLTDHAERGAVIHYARLGPRILRADTAMIAATTCWQAIAGDWKKQ